LLFFGQRLFGFRNVSWAMSAFPAFRGKPPGLWRRNAYFPAPVPVRRSLENLWGHLAALQLFFIRRRVGIVIAYIFVYY
jgi:hypothetical protein